MMNGPRVLVMGCGGIGGLIAATLTEHNHDVVVITHNPSITDAINTRGFTVRNDDNIRVVRGHAHTEIPSGIGSFDFVFLATQPPQVVEAARTALPYLKDNGAMVCLQNGLCEQHVEPVVGPERTIGAIVAWGASMSTPGVYERTSGGGFVIGQLDGRDDLRLATLRELLRSRSARSRSRTTWRRALEQAGDQLRHQLARHHRRRASRRAHPLSLRAPSRPRGDDRGGHRCARKTTCGSRRCPAPSTSSGSH